MRVSAPGKVENKGKEGIINGVKFLMNWEEGCFIHNIVGQQVEL